MFLERSIFPLPLREMGRTQLKTKLRRKVFVEETQQPAAPAPTVEALLEKAQELIVQCDYELARKFIQRALEQRPDNAVAKEMLGVSHLELGELEQAKQVRAATSSPRSLILIDA